MTPCRLDLMWTAGHPITYIAQKLQIPVGEVCARLTQGGWLRAEAYPLCRRAKVVPPKTVAQRLR